MTPEEFAELLLQVETLRAWVSYGVVGLCFHLGLDMWTLIHRALQCKRLP